jgi:inorganic pyrophosphatase
VLESKEVRIDKFQDKVDAFRIITEAIEHYKTKFA